MLCIFSFAIVGKCVIGDGLAFVFNAYVLYDGVGICVCVCAGAVCARANIKLITVCLILWCVYMYAMFICLCGGRDCICICLVDLSTYLSTWYIDRLSKANHIR